MQIKTREVIKGKFERYKGPPKVEEYKGWAIRLPYEYYALAGVGFWGQPPSHAGGVRTAIFRTRREADAARTARGESLWFEGKTRVVRVCVNICEVC